MSTTNKNKSANTTERNANKPMVVIEKLNKSFGDLHVLKDISLTVMPHEVLVIVGPSGSGKSTLLRCVNYLERPDSGRILIDDEVMGLDNDEKWGEIQDDMIDKMVRLRKSLQPYILKLP